MFGNMPVLYDEFISIEITGLISFVMSL